MSRTDVQEMVKLCKGLGLNVAFEGGLGHYTVRDPASEAKLFYISSTPSDSNFKYEIARHLRRLGLLKGNLKFGKFKTITRRKKYGPIDLVALRKAQAAAESAGERIPLLEDLQDNGHGFFRTSGIRQGHTKEAEQEAIDNMAMKLSPRGAATKQRLRKTLTEKGIKQKEFVELAIQVGEERGLRTWPKVETGQSILNKFIKDDTTTLQLWGINLVEATLDTIDGLKWVTNRNEPPPTVDAFGPEPEDVDPGSDLPADPQYITEETVLNILDNFRVQIQNQMEEILDGDLQPTSNNLRERYADTLLKLLESNPSMELDTVMRRLDKLVGLEV